MRKNLFFSLFATMVLLLTTACQQDEVFVDGNATVTFKVSTPEMVTRAYSDGKMAKNLQYHVYLDENGSLTYLDKLDGAKTMEDNGATVSIDLATGKTYHVLFWAAANGAPYTVYPATHTMTVDYNGALNNDETRDAFYSWHTIQVNNNEPQDVILHRPFAQLNIGTDDIDEAEKAGLDITQVGVTVSKVYTTLNFASGEVDGETSVVFGKALRPENENFPVQPETYKYLAMNYLLVSSTKSIADVEMSYDDQTRTYTNIPLQRNHRTNIYGSLLTKGIGFDVEIEDEFGGESENIEVWDGTSVTEPEYDATTATYTVSTGAELAWLVELVNGTTTRAGANNLEGVTIKLTQDVDLGGNEWTPIGFNPNDVAGNETYFAGTFDGNNHVISNLKISKKDQGGIGLFGAVYNATFKNFTLRNVDIKAVESEADPTNSSGAEGKANYIAGGHLGAIAGYDVQGSSYINFENVHVTGLIKIEGETRAAQGQRIGGIIGGRGQSNYTFKQVSVKGDDGSYIKGYCSTAGVVGQNQQPATFENVETDIDVYAVTFGAGGIAGIARQSSTFTDCSSAGNITLDASKTQLSSYSANYPFRVGGIAGCWSESKTGVLTLTNCSYTGTLTSIDKDGKSPEVFDYAGYVGRGYTLNGCAGSKVIINGVEYVQAFDKAADAGIYYVNGELVLSTAAALRTFAQKVNTGADYFGGKTIKLGADIDLKNEEWTPIGSFAKDHGFMGNFDGNGKTIKNLKITKIALDADNYAYAGLFGLTEGVDEDNQNYIKNLTIENVTINTTGHIVAAAIAYPYYTALENILVKGDVKIKGGNYTAGVLAYTRRCVDANKIVINANEGSVIEGAYTIGGVISDIQTNGGLVANYSKFEATGLTIKGTKCVGGISGIISNQTLNGATVKNVAIDSEDRRKGAISGAFDGESVINNAIVENVTGADDFVGALYEGTMSETTSVTINGLKYTYNNGLLIDGYEVLADGLLKKGSEYKVINANGLVALSAMTIKGGEVVTLGADIDLKGVEFNGLRAFNPENNNTFDGKDFTVSNWTNNSGASDMGFIKEWVGPIKNVKFDNCHLKTSGRSAIVAAKVYSNIENVEVKGSSIEDSYWACGIVAGLYNNGSVSNVTVTNSSVKSNGGTGGIVGVMNESAGTRGFYNCSISNSTVNNTGVYGEGYSAALICGILNTKGSTIEFKGCSYEGNTKKGQFVGDLYYDKGNNNVVVE